MRQGTNNSCQLDHGMCASQVRDAASAVKYAQQMQLLAEGLAVEAEELPGGRINYVFKLSQPSGTTPALLLKYCPPYVKCMGADVFPLTQASHSQQAVTLWSNQLHQLDARALTLTGAGALAC